MPLPYRVILNFLIMFELLKKQEVGYRYAPHWGELNYAVENYVELFRSF